MPGGRYVLIEVADTGGGLHEDVADRLFQPFVTSKAHGMGVGLSICHTIVEAHTGRLWAEKRPERVLSVRFTLPRHGGEA